MTPVQKLSGSATARSKGEKRSAQLTNPKRRPCSKASLHLTRRNSIYPSSRGRHQHRQGRIWHRKLIWNIEHRTYRWGVWNHMKGQKENKVWDERASTPGEVTEHRGRARRQRFVRERSKVFFLATTRAVYIIIWWE